MATSECPQCGALRQPAATACPTCLFEFEAVDAPVQAELASPGRRLSRGQVTLIAGTVVLGLGTAVLLVANLLGPGDGSLAAGEPSSSASASTPATATASESVAPVASTTPGAQPSPSGTAAAGSCSGDTLVVDCFARVIVDVLRVRTGPRLDAPPLLEHYADDPVPGEVLIGRTSGREQVFIADGPVQADGLAWYQVGVMNTENEQSTDPLFVGWVASSDGTDAWLVPQDPCPPAGPVELADLTYAELETAWAIHLGCYGDQVLTLGGWFPVLPSEFEIPYDTDGSCFAEPAFLLCGPYNKFIRTAERSFYDGNDHLNFTMDPATGVELPERGQWIEITGAFDHPAAQQCGDDAGGTLACRAVFVATDIAVSN